MKKLLILLLLPFTLSAQYYSDYANIAALKANCQLIEGQTYVITELFFYSKNVLSLPHN